MGQVLLPQKVPVPMGYSQDSVLGDKGGFPWFLHPLHKLDLMLQAWVPGASREPQTGDESTRWGTLKAPPPSTWICAPIAVFMFLHY